MHSFLLLTSQKYFGHYDYGHSLTNFNFLINSKHFLSIVILDFLEKIHKTHKSIPAQEHNFVIGLKLEFLSLNSVIIFLIIRHLNGKDKKNAIQER